MGRLKAQNLAKIYLEICQELENSAIFDDHDDLVATLDGFADAVVEGVECGLGMDEGAKAIEAAYEDVITDNQLGIARDIEMPEAFAQAIRDVAEQPRASYDAMCERVRAVAQRFDYAVLAKQEIEVIERALTEK